MSFIAKLKLVASKRERNLSPIMLRWAAAGFKDTLLRLSMKQEIANGNEKAIQSGVQG